MSEAQSQKKKEYIRIQRTRKERRERRLAGIAERRRLATEVRNSEK